MEQKASNRNPFISIVYFLFPFVSNYVNNKKIRETLNSIGDQLPYESENSFLCCFKSPEKVDTNVLRDMIADNRHRMERLEDKAKVQIVGITIAISIVFGVTGQLKEITYLKWTAFILLVLSVVLMTCSGLYAFWLLINDNIFYYPPSNISEMGDDEKRKIYNALILKNQLQNVIRNNEISTSYELMRNAIIMLIIVFVIWNIPIA